MAMICDSPRAERKLASSDGYVDCFPDEVIGIILSHVPCVRGLVMASLTCRKWQEAAWTYVDRLNFTESDFVSRGVAMTRLSRETIISSVVMKVKALRVLSICIDKSVGIQAYPLITWLEFAKKSLMSLTLENQIQPKVNILDTLGGAQSKLKHLKWESAYLPSIDPVQHSFQFLVSLFLTRTRGLLPANLELLLCICPSLASLHLEDMDIRSHPGATLLELKSSSLKALHIVGGFTEIDQVVLYMEYLDCLAVQGTNFQLIKLVQEKGCSLRKLINDNASVTKWEIGEVVNSLHGLELTQGDDFADEWPRYYQMISRASDLQELRLSGHAHNHEGINLNEIAASFPQLNQLAVEYEHASSVFEACSSTMSLNFEKLAILQLSARRIDEPFALWIAQFLRWCPCLKRLTIRGEVFHPKIRYTKPLCMFNTAMFEIMRSYPQVKVIFDFY